MEQLLSFLGAHGLSGLWWAFLIGAAYLVLRGSGRNDDARSIRISVGDSLKSSGLSPTAVLEVLRGVLARRRTDPARSSDGAVREPGHGAPDDATPAQGPAPAPDDKERSFHLRFDTGQPSADALPRGKVVRLVFGEGTPLSPVSSSFPASSLQLPLQGRTQLTLAVTPDEGLDVIGPEVGVATFLSGRLEREVGFDLRVRDDCPDTVTVLVEFFLRGIRVHGHSLTARVVSEPAARADLSAGARRSVPLQLGRLEKAAERIPVAAGLIELKLRCGSGGLQLSLSHRRPGPVDVVAKSLDASVSGVNLAGLATIVSLVRGQLGDTFFASDLWEHPVIQAATSKGVNDLAECFERVASAGWLMRSELLRDSAEARTLFDYIDAQPEGTRLVVNTSGPLLPFEILYGLEFSADWLPEDRARRPVDPRRFWGLRFALEIIKPRQGDGLDLLNAHHSSKRSVSLNLHPQLTGTQQPDPPRVHRDLEAALLQKEVACHSNRECKPMRQVLQGGSPDIRLIYVYCHGQPAEAAQVEELELAPGCRLKPTGLSPEARLLSAPIVFLNACSSGASSPLLFTGFLEAFYRQGALGLIATNFSVPVAFGATFGAEVIQVCLFPKLALAEEVRELRLSHAQRGNPVPLFYSVQCQLV